MYQKAFRAMRLIMASGLLLLFCGGAWAQGPKTEILLYCGITMVNPMTEIAKMMEERENIKITISQGGSEDLYQSAKRSGLGDLYFPGESSYREKHVSEGLLGEYTTVGYNQAALVVRKGNPKKVKADPAELLRDDLAVMIGNSESGSVGKQTEKMLKSLNIYDAVIEKAVALFPDSRNLNAALRKGEGDVILNWRATAFFPDNAPFMEVLDLDPKIAKLEPLQLTLLTFSKHPDIAKRIIQFTASPEGQAIFRKHGFFDSVGSANP